LIQYPEEIVVNILIAAPGDDVIPLGAYGRVSDDDRDETGQFTREGVTRQMKDCHKLSDDLSVQMGTDVCIVREYIDNNITAADESVTRPEFEHLLKDLESGVIKGIVFYHADRIARLEFDAARVCRLYRLNPRLIGLSITGGVDLSKDEGRAMFMMQAVMGGMEVSANRRRVTRQNKDRAAEGKRHGGKRPFGWETNRKHVRQWEADLLAKGIRDVPKGKTVGEIRREWIEAGVGPTAEGKRPLTQATVLSRLINPRACGYRVYMSAQDRREAKSVWLPDTVLYGSEGNPVIGDWEAIVTPDEWKACVATLEDRRGKRNNPEFTRLHAKYLLSGIARCGECGARLYGKPRYEQNTYQYRCLKIEGGCGGVGRIGPPLDALVEELFLKATAEAPGPVRHENVDDTIHDARLAELRQEIRDVMARRKPDHPKRISTTVAMDMVADLEKEIRDLTYKARALTAEKVQRQQATPSLLKEWESYTTDMKRDRLQRDIRAVIVNQSQRGKRFDPSLIEIVWAE
jgi:DNA invertase Pin-like site-specific DNA recombinase